MRNYWLFGGREGRSIRLSGAIRSALRRNSFHVGGDLLDERRLGAYYDVEGEIDRDLSPPNFSHVLFRSHIGGIEPDRSVEAAGSF